ncbi:54S ribosomal protein L31 [Paramyrothecium foliicola]|nr:54S ribosomal protein L31 [Paramyrothecium foliicola]
MFGPFRITNPLSGGLLWKIPWRLSKFQKRRQRLRLRAVDDVVATLDAALAKKGQTLESLERWKAEMPTEAEMLPRDKYTMFSRTAKRYRKGIHSESPLLLCPAIGAGFTSQSSLDSVHAWILIMESRTAEVDKGLAKNQPSWFLRWTAFTNWSHPTRQFSDEHGRRLV